MKIKISILFSCLFCLCFSQKKELKPFVDFLQQRKFHTAKEYIMQKFNEKDIVIISERHHADMAQYDFILEVLKDQNFKGNIYTEVGCSNNYKRINRFLLNSQLSEKEKEKELLSIYRDLDYEVIWEKYNYYHLLSSIFEINKSRDEKDKILLFPLDIEFDWNSYKCHSHYKMFDEYLENGTIPRNEIMGKNFVKFYEYAKIRNPERKKALVIENTYHGYIRIPKFSPLPTQPDIYSTGEYIYKTYPEITTNIYVNYAIQILEKGLTNNGLFDAAFAFTKIDNIGFDLKNTPFGNAEFDLYFFGDGYEQVNFDYVFDGMIFYKPVSEMVLVIGIPNVYPKEFENQFYERIALMEGIAYEQAKKENAEFFKEINQKRTVELPNEVLEIIKKQINYWLE